MIYFVLLAVAVISLFHFIFSEYKSHMTAAVIAMLASLSLAYFFFILYVCKVSFHLSLFQRYFPIPRDLVMFLYAFPLSKQTVLSLLNLFCVLFLASNLWLSQMFWPPRLKGAQKAIFIAAGIFFAAQLALYDPYVHIRLYSMLYPDILQREAIKSLYNVLHIVTKTVNMALLGACVLSIFYGYYSAPPLKVMRASMGVFFTGTYNAVCHLPDLFHGPSKAVDRLCIKSRHRHLPSTVLWRLYSGLCHIPLCADTVGRYAHIYRLPPDDFARQAGYKEPEHCPNHRGSQHAHPYLLPLYEKRSPLL